MSKKRLPKNNGRITSRDFFLRGFLGDVFVPDREKNGVRKNGNDDVKDPSEGDDSLNSKTLLGTKASIRELRQELVIQEIGKPVDDLNGQERREILRRVLEIKNTGVGFRKERI